MTPRAVVVVLAAWALSLVMVAFIARGRDTSDDDTAYLNSRLEELAAKVNVLQTQGLPAQSPTPGLETLVVTRKTEAPPREVAIGSALVELCLTASFVHGGGSATVCRDILIDSESNPIAQGRSLRTRDCWRSAQVGLVLPGCWLEGG